MPSNIQLVVRASDGSTKTLQYAPGGKHVADSQSSYKLVVDGGDKLPAGTKVVRKANNIVFEFADGGQFEMTNWCGVDQSKLIDLVGSEGFVVEQSASVPLSELSSNACTVVTETGQLVGTLGDAAALGAASTTAPAAAPAAAGFNPAYLLAGLGVVGVAAAGGGGGGGGGSSPPPPPGGEVPAAPAAAPDMTAATDSGASDTDNNTRDNTPAFSVAAPPAGTTPVLFIDGVETGADFDAASNTFTLRDALPDGAHSATTALRNSTGTSSASPALAFNVDTAAPGAPSIVAVADNAGGGINASEDDDGAEIEVAIPADAQPGDVLNLTLGAQSLTYTIQPGDAGSNVLIPVSASILGALAEGDHDVIASITDLQGNVGASSAAFPITLDRIAPAQPPALDLDAASDSGALNSDDKTNDTTPTFSVPAGTAQPGELASISIDGTPAGSATVQADGSFAFSPSTALGEGNHTISYTITDAAGNVSPAAPTLTFVIDTTAPSAPSITAIPENAGGGVNLAEASDGSASDRLRIDVAIPADAQAGDVLTLTFGAGPAAQTLIYTVLATDVGASASVPVGDALLTVLADGTYPVSATLTDSAGNVSAASAASSLTLDRTAPGQPSQPDMTAGTDSGSSDTDNNTRDTTPSFAIAAPASGESAALYVNGVATQASFDPDTNTLTPVAPLGDGSYTISTRLTDAAGNQSLLAPVLNLVVDTAAPSAPGAAPDLLAASDSGIATDNYTNDATPSFAVSVPAGLSAALYVDGVKVLSNFDGTNLTAVNPIVDGSRNITYSVIDLAGNEGGQSPALTMTVDTIEPNAPASVLVPENDAGGISAAEDDDGTQLSITLAADIKLGDAIAIQIPGQSPVTQIFPAGPTTLTLTLPPSVLTALGAGNHNLSATITDQAGNVSAFSAPFTLALVASETTAPTIAEVPENSSGGISAAETDAGTAVVVDLAGVTIAGGTALAAGHVIRISIGSRTVDTTVQAGDLGNSITVTVPESDLDALLDGVYAATAQALDNQLQNGGPISAPFAVTIDRSNPGQALLPSLLDSTDSGSSATDNVTAFNRPSILISPVPGASEVPLLYVDAVPVAATFDPVSNTLTPLSVIADGVHTITTGLRDSQGNTGLASPGLSIEIDTVAPGAPIIAPDMTVTTDTGPSNSDNITGDLTPSFSLSVPGGTTPNLYIDGVKVAASVSGNVLTPANPIPDGNHTASYTLSDSAGNESAPSPSLNFTVDTSLPTSGAEASGAPSEVISLDDLFEPSEVSTSAAVSTTAVGVTASSISTLVGDELVQPLSELLPKS